MKKYFFLPLLCVGSIFLSCSRQHFSFDAMFGCVGVYNMVTGSVIADVTAHPVTVPLPLIIVNEGTEQKIDIALTATDVFDCPVSLEFETSLLIPESVFVYETKLPLRLSNGYYRIKGTLSDGKSEKRIVTEIGVIPPPVPGLRNNSFFASNTSYLRTGEELKLLQMLGIKIQRTHFHPNQNFDRIPPSSKPLPIDFSEQDQLFRESADYGIWVLPIVGYAFTGTRSVTAQSMNMHGPPRHYGEFVETWKTILKHYPEIDTYEFWNEPWIYGWTWADDAEAYRLLHNKWIRMAYSVNPKIKVIAGNSCMFVEDHLELYPETYEDILTGISHHPYSGAGQKSMRQSGQARSIDYGYLTNKRLGLERYYLTEGGTVYKSDYSVLSDSLQRQITELKEIVNGLSSGDAYLAFIDAYNNLKQSLYNIKITPDKKAQHISQLKRIIQNIFGQPEQRTEELALFGKCWEDINSQTDMLYSIPNAHNSNINAAKIIQYQVRSFLSGAFQGNMQWEIGYGPEWTRCNTAVAVCNHLIEDRPIVADIWPEHELIYGAIFAPPGRITKEVTTLPRAHELNSRWQITVPEEGVADSLLVAVLYCITGCDYHRLDQKGRLSIKNARDIMAFDMSGRPIAKQGDMLTVPFNQYAVYLTTNKMSVLQFRERIASAEMAFLTPLNFYATSLFKPVTEKQMLLVRIENQINRMLMGKMVLKLADSTYSPASKFEIAPAKLHMIKLEWPGAEKNDLNRYPVELIAEIEGRRYYRQQLLSVAAFSPMTAVVDAELNEWQNSQPVFLDSDHFKTDIDLTQQLLYPALRSPAGDAAEENRIVGEVYTGYDAGNIYLAAEIYEPQLHNDAGEVFSVNGVLTKFQQGMPAGFNHIRFTGDALIFAFGFRDRVPGWGRQMDDPYAWKGHFYDSDYTYVAHVSTQGDQLVRLWGKNTGRRNAYQGAEMTGVGAVPGARIKIRRDSNAGCSIYELSIPRKEIDLFNPQSEFFRFAFLLANDEGLGTSGVLSWPQAAGVFDYWCASGSFGPTWQSDLPCQTFWGISK